ncbi:MBL fold metallo-hydrolase [Virgibacillus oceani]|uniref:MBL fold hydrolase n=1 Tax=Virgibacillus oceani TaxID=1479511 RepID=A0A917H5K3_9BACI|nr:MBL fold metallo-hydrolase [Virgibacillus oceani]GGG67832.1 MBL fold hydrolase [Virgibacillus oceani]
MERFRYDDIDIVKITVNPVFPIMNVYLYFIDGILVDTGPSIQKRNLLPVFKEWDIRYAAITHHHEDHAGLARWIDKHVSAEILCHEKMVPIAHKNASLPWYRTLFSGPRLAFNGRPYPKVVETPRYQFYPIDTPGHTFDHVCLFEPYNGWLFTGDLYITPYPKVFLKEESISSYIDSIEQLNKLDYQTLFCGHEGIVTNGKEMMNRKLQYLQRTKKEVIRLHKLGCNDRSIIKKLFPNQVKLETASFGAFSRRNLVRSCYRDGLN